jgi:hypothetical protein
LSKKHFFKIEDFEFLRTFGARRQSSIYQKTKGFLKTAKLFDSLPFIKKPLVLSSQNLTFGRVLISSIFEEKARVVKKPAVLSIQK